MGALSLAVDQPAHETDQSFPSSIKVKNVWSCTTTPPNAFMAWCLITPYWLHLYPPRYYLNI